MIPDTDDDFTCAICCLWVFLLMHFSHELSTPRQSCKLQHLFSAASNFYCCCIDQWFIYLSCGPYWSAWKCCWLFAPTSFSFFFFLLWSKKPVLFVSSGPKPCEACRQEEIYEEPISILNSNEVSHGVCRFSQHCYVMRHLPCNLYTIPHPHPVTKKKIMSPVWRENPSLQTHNLICYVSLRL